MKQGFILLVATTVFFGAWLAAASADGTSYCGETTRQYECRHPVETRAAAARCFSTYFTETLELLRQQRGTLPSIVEGLLQGVSEDSIVLRNDAFHIDRDGKPSPYFIQNGVIYLKLE